MISIGIYGQDNMGVTFFVKQPCSRITIIQRCTVCDGSSLIMAVCRDRLLESVKRMLGKKPVRRWLATALLQ